MRKNVEKFIIDDGSGSGHCIYLHYHGDESLIIESFNQDSNETSRVVVYGDQIVILLKFIVKKFGVGRCPIRRPDGKCIDTLIN